MNYFKKINKTIMRIFLLVLAVFCTVTLIKNNVDAKVYDENAISDLKNKITNISGNTEISKLLQDQIKAYFDESVVYALPSEIKDDDSISIIISLSMNSLYDEFKNQSVVKEFKDFLTTKEASELNKEISGDIVKNLQILNNAKVDYTLGEKYNTLLAGFEIEIKAKDFDLVNTLLQEETLIIGDVYEKCETEVVTNDVDVYETGIFDSSNVTYQGDGVVVAVLDTGLDYSHSAFSVENFTTTKEAFTLETVASRIARTKASEFTYGLTAEDVYVNKKVPYAYDYADKDTDVSPINNEHGTHVAGIIAGKDDTITGVAPNAQLAIFKVFSDHTEGAKTSWLIAALEDCVTLGVDVINMSLGSNCGFTREVDKENINVIYDKVKDSGIELIASAGNSYNATMGSEKNGNNGLTSNPDSGTIGSPSTYNAALSIASVEGVKTSYLKIKDTIIYFDEASTNNADIKKDFVGDILSTLDGDVTSHDFEYVAIPGIGRSSDYPEEDSFYEGKIVLVKRGTTTFEDKVRVALKEKGASGIIIYNNVSGQIRMSVGANIGAVCSLSQDDGEYLISQINPETGIGILTISKGQLAGPFMSDFSSWGPTSDLKIKPEITAHGGQILSAVPGQNYERLSGTSMAAPNLTGAAALICQYVKYSGVFGNDLSTAEVTNIVNQLMMSTADIIYDKNGLPSAVRKQGAGLISISKSTSSESYITTFDKDNNLMDKAKLELGDDKEKTGVYNMKMNINNITSNAQSYSITPMVLTEGVSTIYTSHSDTTVTQQAYKLDGAKLEVKSISNGTHDGNNVTIEAHKSATVELSITLSDADKKYLDESFANGMYVEGFILFNALNDTLVSINVPFLGFYGDWTQAPIFDEEYYDTHKDEINKGLDDSDKLMADAYATRVIGGLYSDYISTLGEYQFKQNPMATQIAASKEHIAVSNQDKGDGTSTISSIRSINAGLLRNAKEIDISIVEESTGRVIYNDTVYNQHKSFSSGSTIYPSNIDLDYNILDNNLKNNTRYIVTLSAYIDYGTKEEQKNLRNTFTFPFYVDFEAPIVTDVIYRTEYDRSSKKTSLFADLYIYDNHYASGVQIGQITKAPEDSEYTFNMNTFGKYVTPIYSSYNSTSIVTIELTDYVNQLKNSCGIRYFEDGSFEVALNTNTFIASVYDYALNNATYEIELPDEITHLYFNDQQINLSPNETLDLSTVLNIYPSTSWIQVLDFTSSDDEIVSVVNNTLIAKASGNVTITATGKDIEGNVISTSMDVKVLSPGDDGYVGTYSIPEINKFQLTGYTTLKAYYDIDSDKRDIGVTDGTYDFEDSISLDMYPSEQVKLEYVLDSYFPDKTLVTFKSSNNKFATVSEDGIITAVAKGSTTVMVSVNFEGKSSLYSARVSITVKDPFNMQSIYLYSYRGLGGVVEIPGDRGITTIYDYAFSNYEYVEKDLENGDVIDDEDPYHIKQHYIGEDTITKVIIPEGVTTINQYAFANMTALEEVVLPTTLTRIGVGAFYDCPNLKKINLDHVKFINEKAFYNCPIEEASFDSAVSIGDYAFENCHLAYVELPSCAQSVSKGAFFNNQYLTSVTLKAKKIKIGSYAFASCPKLSKININASVISSYAFQDCNELNDVTLGADVSVIGEYAFSGTSVKEFKLSAKNPYLKLEENGALILKGTELLLAAPNYVGASNTITTSATTISTGAFAGNKKVFYLVANNVKNIGPYAFANCTNLKSVTMPLVENIDDYAFYNTNIDALNDLNNLKNIGNYAFSGIKIETLTLGNDINIGKYAFSLCIYLKTITLGDNVKIGDYAFYNRIYSYEYDATQSFIHYTPYTYDVLDEEGNVIKTNSYYRYNFADGIISALKTVNAGANLVVGESAFYGNGKLQTVNLQDNTEIKDYAFYSCAALDTIDFSCITSIGNYAFSGGVSIDYCLEDNVWRYAYEKEFNDGVFINTAYVYSCYAPCFTSADLTNVTYFGEGAFLGNIHLKTVILSQNVSAIEKETFANCNNLEEVIFNDNITEIKEKAFFASGLKNIDLTNIDIIGNQAFYNTKITEVTFKDGVSIGDYVFYYDKSLTNINNANNISSIGKYAFALTSIESIDLSNATLIDDFAFIQSKLTSVIFGEKLERLGENPFYGCEIKSFGKKVVKEYNGSIVEESLNENYDINSKVKVVDGVLYQVVPNGLELVSYPMLKEDVDYTILPDTTRISAAAFAYAPLRTVTLSNVLRAIGDKAFYGCANLNVVTFTSFDAPLLEETFNTQILTYDNIPISGYMGEYKGLGISKYYMWNLTSNFTNFYFGANFVDYVGHVNTNLVLVKPVNGNNYDSFIFAKYFNSIVNGAASPSLSTIDVIKAISEIPANITLSSESAIIKARNLYNLITNLEQQSLVSNYDALVKAESTLQYLKSREEDPDEPIIDPVEPVENKFATFMKNNAWGFAFSGVVIVGFSLAFVLINLKNNKTKKKDEENE